MPQCRELVLKYQESTDEFRARKVAWCYRNLAKEIYVPISKTKLFKALNIKNRDMQACLPYLNRYCDADEEASIRQIVIADGWI